MLLRVLFLLIISSTTVVGQTPSIRVDKVHSENYCLGSELKIDVTLSGTFSVNNKFSVAVYKGWNESAKTWVFPAELVGGQLLTKLTSAELAGNERFRLSILSSSPQTETDTHVSMMALTTPRIILNTKSGYNHETLNSTDIIELAVKSIPESPGEITLNTGEKFNLVYTGYEFYDGSTTFLNLAKTKPGTYYIQEAKNICGVIQSSGKVSIYVNKIDFFPVAIVPANLCEGSEFSVTFATDGRELPPDTKFKIRFSVSFSSHFQSQKFVDVQARLTGKNELTGIFPGGFDENDSNLGIYAGIVAEDLSMVGHNKLLKVQVKPKPGFSLTTRSSTISLGEQVFISSQPEGHPPFNLTLNTGESFAYNLAVSPHKTTTYRVTKMESGCGTIENPPGSPLTIVVRPGLLLGNALNEHPHFNFCEGETGKIRFRTNDGGAETSYKIEAGTHDKIFFSFPATVVGDSIAFFIPKLLSQNPDLDYSQVQVLRVASSNPSLQSPMVSARIYGQPFIVAADPAQNVVPFPSVIRTDYNVYGGLPFEITLPDNTSRSYDHRNIWFQQFVKKDTTFQLASISNQCFNNSNLTSFPLRVSNPSSHEPSLFLRLTDKNYCLGDSIEVEVFFNGEFETNNQFTLSYSRFAQVQTFPLITVSRPGIYRVKLPDDRDEPYDATIHLSSSLPRLISQTERFYFRTPPRAPSITPEASRVSPANLFIDETNSVRINTTSGSVVTYAIDGVEKTSTADPNGQVWVPVKLSNHTLSEFKVLSVSNSCGTKNSNTNTYLYGLAYKIVTDDDLLTIPRCVGMPAEVRFRVENGKPGTGTRFTLQISKTGDASTYSDIATAEDAHLLRFTTPQLEAGNYYMRIKSSDEIFSDPKPIRIGTLPEAKVYTGGKYADDTTISIPFGSLFYFNTVLKDDEPAGVLYSNDEISVKSSQRTGSIKVTENQTFSISKVWNACGFGNASGRVSLKVKPTIDLARFPSNSDPVVCAGKEIELEYKVNGVTSLSNEFLVFRLVNANQQSVKLDSTSVLSGRIKLRIPDNVGQKYINIIASIASLEASESILYQIYTTPNVTFSGSQTITNGESANLYIRSNNTFAANTMFTLSDGSTHTVLSSYPGRLTELKVKPETTTTYSLKTADNTCGSALIAGSVTVTVQPKLRRWLTVERIAAKDKSTLCNSDTIKIWFNLNTDQLLSSNYFLHIFNEAGESPYSVSMVGNTSPLTAVIPEELGESRPYTLRLVAEDPSVSGSTYSESLYIGTYPSVQVTKPVLFYRPGEEVEAVFKIEGSKPVYFRFGDENFSINRVAQVQSDTFRLSPVSASSTYRIMEVRNSCGPSVVGPDSLFKIELLMAVDSEETNETIRVGPNPTVGTLEILFEKSGERMVELFSLNGRKLLSTKSFTKRFPIDMTTYPAGLYLIRVIDGNKISSLKIIKQ